MNHRMTVTAMLFAMLLCAGLTWASAPTNVTVDLDGPDKGFVDEGLAYTADGDFDLDGPTQTEVNQGQASVREEYAWSYAPASCEDWFPDGSEETFRFAQEDAPGEYTIIVTYTVTVRYKNGTWDRASDSDSVDVDIRIPGLCVAIIKPEADPFVGLAAEERDFEAVAWLDGVELDPEDVTWSWDFGDETPLDDSNPTTHAYAETGSYTVTVNATHLGLQAQAVILAQANPQEAADFEFFARIGIERVDHRGEICDGTQLVVRTAAGHQFTARFYGRLPNGEWNQWGPEGDAAHFGEDEGGIHYEAAAPDTLTTPCGRNGTGQNRVEVCIEQGAEDPPIVVNLYLTLTANNTVVKNHLDVGVIRHHPNEPHQIAWNIRHKDHDGPGPTFDVDVEIYALVGGEPLVTLHNTNVSLHGGHCTWDGKVPREGGMKDAGKGIYTYKIIAGHGTDVGDCKDHDKSEQLVISNVVAHFGEVDRDQGKMPFSVDYNLNRDATAVCMRVYDGQLVPIFTQTGLPADAGNRSTALYEFPIDPASFAGHYSVVLYAWEDDSAAFSNRDGAIKPALQKGAVEYIAPIVEATCARGDLYVDWRDWWPTEVNESVAFKGLEHGFGEMTIVKREWHSGYGDWYEVETGKPAYCAYPTTGDETATYRVTYLDDFGSQATVQDTCEVTVFSLACGDMWFRDVQTPPGGYPDTTTFVATGATTGQFHWEVVNGNDKVDLEDGNDAVSKDDDNSVQVKATGFSAAENDVEIKFSYRRAQDEERARAPVGSVQLTVNRPFLVLLTGYPQDYSSGSGYDSVYRFYLTDLLGHNLPAPIPINESFGAEGSDYAGEQWPGGTPNGLTAGALAQAAAALPAGDPEKQYLEAFLDQNQGLQPFYTLRDDYEIKGGVPSPENPSYNPEPDPGDPVQWREQYYRAGSETPGEGLLLKSHRVRMYIRCARQEE